MSVTKEIFGHMPDGRTVNAYTLKNSSGAYVRILDLGGIVNEIYMPDREGKLDDIVCGFDSVEGYLTGGGYQGALIGRFANRIRGGRFTYNGKNYTLAKNDNGINHLHGGDKGFNIKIWDADVTEGKNGDGDKLALSILSPDGEEGYNGNLKLKVTYTFGCDDILSIHYEAETDADTPANFTNHSYFNLDGIGGGDVLSQLMYIDCDRVTVNDDELVPTGEIIDVTGTKFDFRSFRAIKDSFDNNFILKADGTVKYSAEVRSEKSGRAVEVWTDMPAIQIYNAVMMDGEVPFKRGIKQQPHHAVCLETQYYPDAVNHPNFPSCILKPGEKYDHTTQFRFKTI